MPQADGTACDDGDKCTKDAECSAGKCGGGESVCGCKSTADCAAEDDGDACNGVLYCDTAEAAATCKINPATVVVCKQYDWPCSNRACVAANGQCATFGLDDDTACDDGVACTGGDTCQAGKCVGGESVCGCLSHKDCAAKDDDNLCNGSLYCDTAAFPYSCKTNPATVIACPTGADTSCRKSTCSPQAGACSLVDLADATTCTDGDACTAGDSCLKGECESGDSVCPCKADADCGAFQSADLCAGKLYCDLNADTPGCVINPATVVNCAEVSSGPCASTGCAPKTGSCGPIAFKDGTGCSDGNACTGGDACAAGECVPGPFACTCTGDGDCAGWEDGNACNGTLYCDKAKAPFRCAVDPTSLVVCQNPEDPACADAVCQPKSGLCAVVAKSNGAACDADGNPCTVGDVCFSGSCLAGPNECPCESTAQCQTQEDGDLCNGTLFCSKASLPFRCVVDPNTVVACSTTSDTTCSKNVCQPATGVCGQQPTAQGHPCNADNNACTAGDACDLGACVTATNACTCADDGDCASKDDGNACNGTLFCDKSALPFSCEVHPASVVLCENDGEVGCLTGGCDPTSGKCDLTAAANGTKCEDGVVCTVGDRCQNGNCSPGEAVCACATDSDCAQVDDEDLCNAPLYCDKNSQPSVCRPLHTAVKTCPNPVLPCAVHACDPKTGACVDVPLAAKQGQPCSDGNACTTANTCDNGVCAAKTALSCDDLELCTNDLCHPLKGCVHHTADGPCSDGTECTEGDACEQGKCVPGGARVCDDNVPCTTDSCVMLSGECTSTVTVIKCDDGNACTTDDRCSKAGCSGKTRSCDDDNSCTADTCKSASGCAHVPISGACEDGDACTSSDTCKSAKCQPGPSVDCDDNNACTVDDSCAPSSGCNNVPNTASCSDGSACTTNDKCASGACVGGPAPNCDDGKLCTADSCAPTTGCAYAHNAASCDDNNACTTVDKCDGGVCKGSVAPNCDDANPCTNDGCSAPNGCGHVANTATCNDGDACTTADGCADAKCVGGPAAKCDDSNACTADSCSATAGCQFTDNTAKCDDGNACTPNDTCKAGKCVGDGALNCDDNNACTNDSCVATTGCQNAANSATCDDNNACTTKDTCAAKACAGTAPASCDDGNGCTTDSCEPAKGCVQANNAATCNDGNACTANDRCDDGACAGPTAVTCDDGNPCTNNVCDKNSGCVFIDNTAVCDDSSKCTTKDTCAGGSCLGSGPLSCDDSNVCTTDTCTAATGCVSKPNTASCSDNNACTVGDVCAAGSCESGKTKSCDDGNVCTADACDGGTGDCKNAAISGPCEDANACSAGGICGSGACKSFGKARLFAKTTAHGGKAWARGVVATNDGFVIAGFYDGDEDEDVRLVRIDRAGTNVWKRTPGVVDDGHDRGHGVAGMPDGGFVVAGQTKSLGAAALDLYLARTNSGGTRLWHKKFGGSGDDVGEGVAAQPDGRIAAVGWTKSSGFGDEDAWLVVTDASGTKLAEHTFGTSEKERGQAVVAVTDGFALAGHRELGPAGAYDALVIRTDLDGAERWQRSFGGAKDDFARGIATLDGGFVIAGETESAGAGGRDGWLLRVDGAANLVWERTFGTAAHELFRDVVVNAAGHITAVGDYEKGADGKYDVYAVSTDFHGNLRWQKNVGGSDHDYGYGVASAHDGGVLLVGDTHSYGSDVDQYVVRLDPWGNATCSTAAGCADKRAAACDDAKDCTTSACLKGQCQQLITAGTCDDGKHCTLPGECQKGTCATPAAPPLFTKSSGGTGADVLHAIAHRDGLFAAIGTTTSKGAGGTDVWLVTSDAAATTAVDKTFGTAGTDEGYGIIPHDGGGFMVVGSRRDDPTKKRAVWWARLKNDGSTMFSGLKDDTGDEVGRAIAPWRDRHFLVAGWTDSVGAGGKDAYVLRVKHDGSTDKHEPFGTSGDDMAYGATTVGSDAIVAGITPKSGAGTDCYVLWVRYDLSLKWSKSYGGSGDDACYAVTTSGEGGAYAAGVLRKTGVSGRDQAAVWKVDGAGALQWTATLSGTLDDRANAVVRAAGEGVVFAGTRAGSTASQAIVGRVDRHGNATLLTAIGSTGKLQAFGVALSHSGMMVVGQDVTTANTTAKHWRIDAYGNQACAASGRCESTPPIDCDDGNPCTWDTCTASAGCKHAAATNGSACGANATCQSGVCK